MNKVLVAAALTLPVPALADYMDVAAGRGYDIC